MWNRKSPTQFWNHAIFSQRSSAFIDREFQIKYTKYLIGMGIISMGMILLPAFTLSIQNYSLFIRLADQFSPQITDYLWREKVTLYITFSAIAVANIFLWWFVAHRLTSKLAGPAKVLRNHISRLIRSDYSVSTIRLREGDEFKELINSYNYFYTLLNTHTKRELNDLLLIAKSVNDLNAKGLIDNMIEERCVKLGLDPKKTDEIMQSFNHHFDRGANGEKAPDSRHAS
jgi:hypothetical protein